MKSFKRPRYSLRRATRHGTGPVPTISRNHVLFRFPVKCQTESNIAQSQKLPSQRSSVNASVIVGNFSEPPKSEYFVKYKYSLYRTGVRQKHSLQTNFFPQSSPVTSHYRSSFIGKDLKHTHSTTFKNKVLVNKVNVQSNSSSAELVNNSEESNKKTKETPLKVAQSGKSYFTYGRNKKLKSELCFFYTRFGLCTDKQCRFIHDPERVFVCRRFISGSCQNPGCKLLHTREENRMPVCLRFLSGLCGKNNCPFVHVNIGKNPEICKDFVFRGFCSQGRLCCRLHTWDCVEFWKTGQCSNFEKCPLRHKLCQFGKREKVP
ncbi:zinc finger CCCH-type containing 3 isoform 1 [Galdieria sulphuraria]|uniref:Zinc finger CCCH-type containing 3 isoform 1 n=1 Tax=Galdieria sulphuraria TaxID=130081 RepID=M2Y8M4_GALSU|nr:zinc finger CCCH-type containing 3 isoform 2 [Galdieria sulphuraria]XP_005708929.1 zinc finger CCCH-type containing 3 isoform 1 [Galdieria sulphuraria]EME32408.1 zinc finger CCCH-type containing 3 isoform 2 [Galdieria sulphuraria]EME32409.1 zinc finger CCCH-type containing 3 isoform 1 [Galdieria sulphuraria]|eukprot:XP_005708928.1 zinc finger CCCH-type containing 3 isoform 2 [Galdieria sulphuraria]